MKLQTLHPLTFLLVIPVSLFTFTAFGSALPNSASTDIDSLLRTRLSTGDPADCGSSPFQQPCKDSSAVNLHLPFRSAFKFPALILQSLAWGAKEVRAVAVPELDTRSQSLGNVPSTQDLGTLEPAPDEAILEKRQTLYCGYSLIDIDCGTPGSGASVRIPSIFTMPTLFIRSLVLTSKSLVSALSSTNNEPMSQEVELRAAETAEQEPEKRQALYCGAPGAASNIRAPSIFTLPFLLLNTIYSNPSKVASALPSFFAVPAAIVNSIGSLPVAAASAIPTEKKCAEAEILSPSVELGRLGRSITPSLSSFKSLFPHEQRKENVAERGYPDYCSCNEDGCTPESPTCCANGSCYVPATLWSAAPSQRALSSVWVGVLAAGVGFAELI